MKNLFYLVLIILVLAGAYYLYQEGGKFFSDMQNPERIVQEAANAVNNATGRDVVTPVIPEGPIVEITPVAEGGEQQMQTIVTVLPTPQTRYRLGNASALKQYFHSYVSKGTTYDILVPASLDTVGVGWYCAKLPTVLGIDLPGSVYGSIQTQYTTLYSGVPLSTVVNNIDIQGVNERVVEENSLFVDYGNDAKIVIRVPVGLLTPGFRPGNSFKYTLVEPGLYYRMAIDPLRQILTGDQVLAELRDRVDNRSRLAAELDAIAPLNIDWSRSTEYLDKLYELSVQSLNSSGTLEHPSSYDSIRLYAELAAKDAGFQGLESLTIEVERPETWVYIESFTPVLDPTLDTQLSDSACPEFQPPQEWLDILLNK
ncbi:MAG: hypothetical protein UT08_C0017G0004 [Candidatus Woesebacteria bacterium GW2011_GWB1_38_8]|uniref:Uncharacterized protein n=1 Tax=Candidatus Woesebacteria bacterium GW2011_GWB1_38_8 TaxID=1618570 RepID=A0A0G0L9F7_9BACT|nr:MAG: hypothetical protein UT08_C0017G0004 [Candidatus Woesebacteria bacterium GW2011_GWB1_38_8]